MEAGDRAAGRRIALLIQYDGRLYNGWQVQNGGRTIQGEIERAVHVLTKERVRLTASGRTDAGVHAWGQVAHFDLWKEIDLGRLCIGANGILPKDISILNAYRVPDEFHARYSASSREYTYLVYNEHQRSPFMMYRALWINRPINTDYLRLALGHLVGEMDYASFCKKASAGAGTVRRIDSIEVGRSESLIAVNIKGSAFLHHMVRIIMGTVIEMHLAGRDPSHMLTVIEKRDRSAGGVTAPPFGLYLRKINYEPPLSSRDAAFRLFN